METRLKGKCSWHMINIMFRCFESSILCLFITVCNFPTCTVGLDMKSSKFERLEKEWDTWGRDKGSCFLSFCLLSGILVGKFWLANRCTGLFSHISITLNQVKSCFISPLVKQKLAQFQKDIYSRNPFNYKEGW